MQFHTEHDVWGWGVGGVLYRHNLASHPFLASLEESIQPAHLAPLTWEGDDAQIRNIKRIKKEERIQLGW